MLQQNDPDDFVIATGESHKLAEFASVASERLAHNKGSIMTY
jgi:GDP-D-mannose dehydratase